MFNKEDAQQFYKYLDHKKEEYTELRAIEWNPTGHGQVNQEWVTNEEDFIRFCEAWSGKRHVYVGINPRKQKGGKTEDIGRVVGIPFDIDSPHPREEAATDQEVTIAYAHMEKLLKLITSKGFNKPYIDFSGNGFRVIQKVDIPINDHNLASEKLKTYFQEFKLQIPSLDSIFDLPRIIKVPGTMSIKGTNTEERPHRLSKIRQLGSTVPDEKLKQHLYDIKISKKEITDPIIHQESTTITEDVIIKLTAAQKNEEINDLYNGDWEKYGKGKSKWTRSEAEASLMYRLFMYGLTCDDVERLMHGCKIGKWQEEGQSYRKLSLNKTWQKYKENPLRFFFEKQFVVMNLGDEIQSTDKFVATSSRSPIWCYNPETGIWDNNGEDKIKTTAQEKLGNMTKEHYKKESVSYIRDGNYIPVEALGAPKGKIVCLNGVYDLNTDTLEEYNPDLYALSRIPIKYDNNAECPKIDLFLSQILHKKDITAFYEIAGYCLYKGYPIARIFIFYGEKGRNGKSKALGLINAFLGTENTSSVNLQSLTDDGFRSSNLYGKLANICGDIPGKPIEDTGLIKKITGGDKVTFERKYFDAFDDVCSAKLIFSANQVPPPKYDDTGAFYRRMILIECPNSFIAGEPGTDPHILDKITTPEELSGLFNKAIAGLKTILEKGIFSNEENEETRQLEYMKESDPIQYFAKAYVSQTLDPEYFITNEKLYDHYVFVCNGLKKIPTNNSWFPRQLRRFLPYANFTNTTISGKSVKIVKGIKVDIERIEKDSGGQHTPYTPYTPFNPLYYTTINNTDKIFSTTLDKGKNGVYGVCDVCEEEQISEKKLDLVEKDPNLKEQLDTLYELITKNKEMSEYDLVNKHDYERGQVKKLLSVLKNDGKIYSHRPGVWCIV